MPKRLSWRRTQTASNEIVDNFSYYCATFTKKLPPDMRLKALAEIAKFPVQNPLDTLYYFVRDEDSVGAEQPDYVQLSKTLGLSEARLKFADWFWQKSDREIRAAVIRALQTWIADYHKRNPQTLDSQTSYVV